MSRARTRLVLAVVSLLVLSSPSLFAQAVVLDLRQDPLDPAAPLLVLEGPGSDAFAWEEAARLLPSDPAGALRVVYDATRPTLRAAAPLGAVYTEADDFVFGAILTVRPEGFEADPFGFHPIGFSLVSSATTGFDRTGSPADFRADTFDSLDVAWFPQISPFFGGPFLSPSVFGSPAGDDAFANFTFGLAEFEFAPGVAHLVLAEHRADEKRLTITVHVAGEDGRWLPVPAGSVSAGLAALTGFAVDTLAIPAYEDGYTAFASTGRSVRAEVVYDRLFFAPGRLGEPGSLRSPEALTRRSGNGARGLGR